MKYLTANHNGNCASFNTMFIPITFNENYRRNKAVIPKRQGKDGATMAKKAIPNP